jgi:hypothetical protein
MKTIARQEPGYSFDFMWTMLTRVQYRQSEPASEPWIAVGWLLACPTEADCVITDLLKFAKAGALSLDFGKLDASLAEGILDAIVAQALTLERSTLLVRNVDRATSRHLPRLLAIFDDYRPLPVVLATAGTLGNVHPEIRRRFVNYLGLNQGNQMTFGLPDGQLLSVDGEP